MLLQLSKLHLKKKENMSESSMKKSLCFIFKHCWYCFEFAFRPNQNWGWLFQLFGRNLGGRF